MYVSVFHWQFLITCFFPESLKFDPCYIMGQWGEFTVKSATLCLHILSQHFLLFFIKEFFDCESFLESNSPDILALHEKNLEDSIDSGNSFIKGYLPLIWKDFVTHVHGLAVYEKEGCTFAWDLSLENYVDTYLCFWMVLLHSLSYFFFLYWSHSLS